MDWLNISAEAGLWGLLAASFLSATLLPGGSEAVLLGLLYLHPDQTVSALCVATLGNTAGGMTSWACGRWLPTGSMKTALPRANWVRRWGAPALALAWVPLIGDALCVAAGWLRLHWLPCLGFIALGKFVRYWVLISATGV